MERSEAPDPAPDELPPAPGPFAIVDSVATGTMLTVAAPQTTMATLRHLGALPPPPLPVMLCHTVRAFTFTITHADESLHTHVMDAVVRFALLRRPSHS